MRPAPPVFTSASWLQPALPCEEFHDFMCRVSANPCRSKWPTIAEPSPLFVQLPQVVSPPAVENMPIGSEPVRMSCSFGVSPRPLIGWPFSSSAFCLLILLLAECRSATLVATTTPLALRHGPLPMRSRALTPAAPFGSVVLRYAFQLVRLEPASLARVLQYASAPSSPPRSAPLPLPLLVTKNVISPLPFFALSFLSCACKGAPMPAETRNAAATIAESFIETSDGVGGEPKSSRKPANIPRRSAIPPGSLAAPARVQGEVQAAAGSAERRSISVELRGITFALAVEEHLDRGAFVPAGLEVDDPQAAVALAEHAVHHVGPHALRRAHAHAVFGSRLT